jgi:iron complex transport system ATP-binding protein
VLLARALAQEAGVLLLDEATANLDMRHSLEIMHLIRKKAASGITIISVMHDLNLAACWCNRVLLMKKGLIVTQGPPNDVYTAETIRRIYEADIFVGRDPDGHPYVLPRIHSPESDALEKEGADEYEDTAQVAP